MLDVSNTALAEDGYNNYQSFNESLSCRMLSALVPLNKGTKVTFSIWTGDAGVKVDANGAITMISGLTHTDPKSYIGQLCFICQ